MHRNGLVDTHCHLQSARFLPDLSILVSEARSRGVDDMIICAGSREDWRECRRIAHDYDLAYTLGIHPFFTPFATEEDLERLLTVCQNSLDDPHFVGIGEIGLDGIETTLDWEKQEYFFQQQLKIARQLDLPCSIHSRKSEDRLLKYLNRYPVKGVVHAFNGSAVFRQRLLELGLKLGFGGALTYEGSRRIRNHIQELSMTDWVLETDAPDMPNAERREAGDLRTEPSDLADTAILVAELRDKDFLEVVKQSRMNAYDAFPRLALRYPLS